ncbi:MAG: hypothetical protein HC906_16150 [Bacteroidales bacterium]|nr:hypothetical protein [Bacteroidales bacterium]
MKYIFHSIVFISFFIFSCEKDDAPKKETESVIDSVSLGTGYANDVFYNLTDGSDETALRNTWDIGFRTKAFSSSIIINSGAGVELYEISKDTNDWNNPVDTSGLQNWEKLNNSLEDWEVGAFSANMTNHPDYGWGKYNDLTHDLFGSAIFCR